MTALTLLPDLFAGCEPDIRSMRAALDTGHLLVALRACCDAHLPVMARPVGFAVRTVATSDPLPVPQHALGRDPPGGGSQGSVILQTRRESTLMRIDLEEHRTNIALFRHSIVAPLQFLTGAALAAAIRTLAARSWVIPGSRRTAIAGQTLRDWLRAYRARGFEGLKPKPRADQGKPRRMPVEVAEALIAHRQGNPAQSVRDAIAALRDAGSIPRTSPVSTAAVYRLFHREGLMDKPAPAAQDHRRYAWPDANALWQSDVMHGPKCDDGRGRRRKTYMIAFLDDASRVVPWSAFALSENTADFLTVFKQALMRRGRPKRLYCDNGASCRSRQLAVVCAKLDIALIHATPYRPAGKGKIERYNRTVRSRFLPSLTPADTRDIETLNRRLAAWVEGEYHHTPHRGLDGMTPLDKWATCCDDVRLVDHSIDLDELCLFEVQRRVAKDRTVSLHNRIYEVDAILVGERVTLRWDPEAPPGRPFRVVHNGKEAGMAHPLDLHANARVKRDTRPTIAFRDLDTK